MQTDLHNDIHDSLYEALRYVEAVDIQASEELLYALSVTAKGVSLIVAALAEAHKDYSVDPLQAEQERPE